MKVKDLKEELSCYDDDMGIVFEVCADYISDCPVRCFRGALVRDLDRRPYPLTVSWMHFRGTEECMQKGGKNDQRRSG